MHHRSSWRHERHPSTRTASTTTEHTSKQQWPSQPQPRLRRMASLTQLFRANKCGKPGAAHLVESLPAVEEQENEKEAPPQRGVYVPTHAAASFARTVSPLSPVRMEDKRRRDGDEQRLSLTSSSSSSRPSSSISSPRRSRRAASDSTNSTNTSYTGNQPPRAQAQQQTEYAAFLAEAEARERATRKRIHDSPRKREPAAFRGPLASVCAGMAVAPGHRDSAYCSKGSSDVSGGAAPGAGIGGGGAIGTTGDLLAKLPAARSMVANRQPKTLRRRLSDYLKPPSGEVGGVSVTD